MYFNNFPKIYYDFPVKEGQANTLHILSDITSNVRIRKEVLENITLYDEYDMLDGETPEMVAEKIYGNAEYHWIIMLANQRYDYLKDFPMSSAELYKHTAYLYGDDGLTDVHHYERDGLIVEGVATMRIPPLVHTLLRKHDFIFTGKANARIESISYEYAATNAIYTTKLKTYSGVKVYDAPLSTRTSENYLGTATLYSYNTSNSSLILGNIEVSTGKSAADIKSVYTESTEFQCDLTVSSFGQPLISVLVDYGKFIPGESVTVRGFRVNDAGNNELINVASYVVPQSGGFTVNENYRLVTNYDYELELNESKRRIKIISPRLVTQLVDEFNKLITP